MWMSVGTALQAEGAAHARALGQDKALCVGAGQGACVARAEGAGGEREERRQQGGGAGLARPCEHRGTGQEVAPQRLWAEEGRT